MEQSSVHYGGIAAKLLGALAGVVVLVLILRPG